MKHSLTILLACICMTAKSQQITISDLVKMFKADDNQNELFLNLKEFTLDRLDTKDSASITWYAYAKKQQTDAADVWVAIANYNDGTKSVLTDFSNLKHFNAQKQLAEKLGFKFSRTVKYNDISRFHEYIKGKLQLLFWTMIDKEKPNYEIALSNRL